MTMPVAEASESGTLASGSRRINRRLGRRGMAVKNGMSLDSQP